MLPSAFLLLSRSNGLAVTVPTLSFLHFFLFPPKSPPFPTRRIQLFCGFLRVFASLSPSPILFSFPFRLSSPRSRLRYCPRLRPRSRPRPHPVFVYGSTPPSPSPFPLRPRSRPCSHPALLCSPSPPFPFPFPLRPRPHDRSRLRSHPRPRYRLRSRP